MNDPEKTFALPFQWILQSDHSPSHTLVKWLVQEIDPKATSPIDSLIASDTPIATLIAFKDAFKHLRLEGETLDDQSLGAVYYGLTIASSIVHHRRRISRQSDRALEEAFRKIWSDETVDLRLRDLTWRAFMILRTAAKDSLPY